MNNINMLEIKNLKKEYDRFSLNINNLSLEKGKVLALIGKNGVGKSTTIKSILGLVEYEAGEILINGMNLKEDEINIKQQIWYVPENIQFYQDIKGKDIGIFLKSCYKNWDNNLFGELCKEFEIDLNKKIKNLSKGNLVKLFLILAVSHHPKLLVLDEPTSGLDPIVRNQILNYLNKIVQEQEIAILFSSHIMEDVEKIANEIAYIDNGMILLNEDKNKIMEDYKIALSRHEDRYLKENSIAFYQDKFLIDYRKNKNYIEERDITILDVTLDKVLEFIINNERRNYESSIS